MYRKRGRKRRYRFIVLIPILTVILLYISTHTKSKLIIEDNVLIGIESGIIERRSSIKQITVPVGVTKLGDNAFRECTKLESVELPETIETIGDSAFEDCYQLEHIELPKNLKNIEESAFRNCVNLKAIELPENLKKLRFNAFRGCHSLEKVNIPLGITAIEGYTFEECKSLKKIILHEGIEKISIGAFLNCQGLEEVEMKEGIKSIRAEAFSGCENIKSIKIPDSVEEIESKAFYSCENLEEIKMSEGIRYVETEVFNETKCYIENLSDKNNDIYIGKVLIKCNRGSSDIKVKEGTRVIANGACAGMENLVSAELPESLICIGDEAFAECHELKDINIPSKLEKIRSKAFYACKIESVDIPETVSFIGFRSFENCVSLKEVKMSHTPEKVSAFVFKNTLWLKNLEQDEYHCKYFQNILLEHSGNDSFVKIQDGTKLIVGLVFSESKGLETVEIPKSVEFIGFGAFRSCENLKEVRFAKGSELKKIDEKAFDGCVSLEEITLPLKLQRVESFAFHSCTGFATITFPDSIEYISNDVVSDCINLKTIRLPKHMKGKYFIDEFDLLRMNPEIIYY